MPISPRYRSEGENILKLFLKKSSTFAFLVSYLMRRLIKINGFEIVFEFVVKTQFIDEEGSKDKYST